MMDIIYEKSSHFDERMASGLMREKYSEIQVECREVVPILEALKKRFKTNLTPGDVSFSSLELLIWLPDEEGNPNAFQITFNERLMRTEGERLIQVLLAEFKEHADSLKGIRVLRDCELNPPRVEKFLGELLKGDIFENVLENIPKLSIIDSETYQGNPEISQKIDELENAFFEELVDKRIRVNGKGGILRKVHGDYGRYGFFERGVRKNYVCLSLVQKMGTRTIREIGFDSTFL